MSPKRWMLLSCVTWGALACAPNAEAPRDEIAPVPAPAAVRQAPPTGDAPESQPAPRAARPEPREAAAAAVEEVAR